MVQEFAPTVKVYRKVFAPLARSSSELLSGAERDAFRARLRQVVEAIGTQALAADVAGVSLRSMKNYLAGRSLPLPYAVASRLAARARFESEWLMTGQGRRNLGPIEGSLDLLQRIPVGANVGTEDAERHRRYMAVALAVSDRLKESYREDEGVVPRVEDVHNAAQTGAALALLAVSVPEADLATAAAQFVATAHRQAHRLLREATPLEAPRKKAARTR